MKLTLLEAGACTAPEHLTRGTGSWRPARLPALFALLEHPRFGMLLFDTGYGLRFFTETRRFPLSLYAKVTPVTLREADLAVHQLARRGLAPGDISHILISHFHADHIAGLRDFPAARLLYFPEAWAAVAGRRGFSALRAAFIPGLLPPDFEARSQPLPPAGTRPQTIASAVAPALLSGALRETAATTPDIARGQVAQNPPARVGRVSAGARPLPPAGTRLLPPEYAPFAEGVDLFGDESAWAVRLPGHAAGQMGLFVRTDGGEHYFLVADACWHSQAYREQRGPHPLANLVFSDPAEYRQTLGRLHQFYLNHPQVHVIPSHCAEAYARYGASE